MIIRKVGKLVAVSQAPIGTLFYGRLNGLPDESTLYVKAQNKRLVVIWSTNPDLQGNDHNICISPDMMMYQVKIRKGKNDQV